MAGGSGVAVTNGVFPWDISSVPDSLLYLVRVTCNQDGAISGQSSGVFSIGPPFVALSLSGSPLAEAGGVATVTATLSSVYELPVTVNLAFSGLATLTSDYAASGASITIPSGSSSGSITLTAVQDTLDETNETIVVDIDTVENGTENGVQQVKATITDDDPLPTVILSLTNSLLAEEAGVATVTASMSAVSGRPVTVNLAFSGTVTPFDYTTSGGSITIPEGSTNGSLTLTAVQDALNEASETLVVDISSVVNGTESGSQQVTVTILDDDPMPAVSLSLTNSPMVEAGGVAMVTATLSSVSGQNVTVNLAFSGIGTLTNDWRRSAAFITVLKGSLRGSMTLTAVQDTLDEANETIVVDIDTVVNATENGVQQVTAIITDDDTSDRQLRVTYPNQGEVLDVGSPVGIIWAASGVDWLPGDTVRLEVSTNSGAAWSPIAGAVSLAYNLGTFSWVTTGLVNLAACRIQVSWNENPSVTDTSDTDFTMRRCFYVNDGSVEHDEWCGAVGSDANTGLDSGHPKATVQGVLSAYTLVPGDTVRMDAGDYALTNGVRVGQEHSGNPAAPVVFEASANGVTVALQNTGEAVWDIHASNVIVRTARSVTNSSATPSWMKVMGGSLGVNALGREVYLSRLDICSNAVGGACLAGENGVIENSLVRDVAGGDGILVFAPAVTIRSCTVSGNAQCGINVGSPDGVRIVNNIIRADGAGKYALSWLSTAGSLFSDYNDLFVTNGAAVGSYGAAVKATLAEWTLTGRDLNSLSADPQWVSLETGDFHLKSVQGRYVSPDLWTNDTAHSACIDAGDPASGSADEPVPNGSRINIGAYGNTEQASRSLTNPVVMLEVRSVMGSTTPLAGLSLYYPGAIVFCQNSGSPVQMGSTQYVCGGWVMQGNEPGAGETNVLTLTLTNNAVLTWLWQALVEPRIAAVPGSLDFGTIQVGTSVEAELSLQNAGGGILNGAAALSELSGPFSLVSGGLYGLATGVTHLVRVRYYPDSEGSHSNGVVFTGGGGLTCGILGRALGNGDSDRDGMSDWNEYLAGTSPSNDASVFAVKGVTLVPGIGVEIQWSTSSNQTYMLERGANLVSGEFTPLLENIPTTPPVNVHTDFVSGVTQGYFYRIKTKRAVE
jgi:hypothetical protein